MNDQVSMTDHIWKQTNAHTESYGERSFDTFKCENCAITGKRFAGDSMIVRDHTFKAKIYADCSKAKAYLDRLR